MTKGTQGPVERWFGAAFTTLHPRLADLHRHGGTLQGVIDLRYGTGIGGWLGRRMGRRLGLPTTEGRVPMIVGIHADDSALHWSRRFGDGTRMDSVFEPTGAWPDGLWIERTGKLTLKLSVVVEHGGWRWVPRAYAFGRIGIPLGLLPRVDAGKWIDDGRYGFSVRATWLPFGLLFSYSGLLDLQAGSSPEAAAGTDRDPPFAV